MPEISPGKTVSFTHRCDDGSRVVYELPDQSSAGVDEDSAAINQSSVGVDEYKPRAYVRLYHSQDSEVIERSIPVPVAKYLIKDTSYSSLDAFEKRLRSIEIIYAHATCARLVSVRERTQYEITTHLKREGYSPSVITAAVEQARQSDMVNDMRFCEVFSHSKMASGRGRKRIEYGLIRHGTQATLTKEVIEAAAKRDEKFVATTFTARFKLKTYKVTFDANIPDGEAPPPAPITTTVEHGKGVNTPDGSSVKREGYILLKWTTGADGSGDTYLPGARIEGITSNMTLYAQWKELEKVVLTYKSEDDAKGTVSLSSEEVIAEGGSVQGACTAVPKEGYELLEWSKDTDNLWSHTQATLTKEVIEAAAKRDEKFVATTFTAHFKLKTYTVTFNANIPDGEAPPPAPITTTVEHGKGVNTPDGSSVKREGYILLKWTTGADGSGNTYLPGARIEGVVGDLILYAQWQKETEQVELAHEPELPEPVQGSDLAVLTQGPNPAKSAQVPNPANPAQGPKQGNTAKRLTPTNQPPELRPARHQEPSYPSGWYQDDNRVFYYRNRRKLTGWHELEGTIQELWSLKKNWFYFDKKGIMLTGRHRLIGGFKNAQGVQEEHWFGLDEKTGAQIRYWQRVADKDGEKWYYYRPEDGTGLVGRHRIVGGFKNAHGVRELNWFYFNKVTGAQIRGWHKIAEDGTENWYYYRDGDGIMLKGRHRLVGGFKNAQGVHEMNWFYFDMVTGIEIRGWHKIVEGGFERWYYYRDGDGIMLKGQHRLIGGFKNAQGVYEMNWFYFDDITGIEIRGWHKIIEGGTKNWYYYRDGDGIMLKGQHRLIGGFKNQQGVYEMNWFYFDDITGVELRNCCKDISSQNKTCYYGSDGAMYKGWRVIGRRWYYFDDATGARH